jgi:hypothetical protein
VVSSVILATTGVPEVALEVALAKEVLGDIPVGPVVLHQEKHREGHRVAECPAVALAAAPDPSTVCAGEVLGNPSVVQSIVDLVPLLAVVPVACPGEAPAEARAKAASEDAVPALVPRLRGGAPPAAGRATHSRVGESGPWVDQPTGVLCSSAAADPLEVRACGRQRRRCNPA